MNASLAVIERLVQAIPGQFTGLWRVLMTKNGAQFRPRLHKLAPASTTPPKWGVALVSGREKARECGYDRLHDAIGEAHQRGSFSAHSVAHILDQRRRATGAPPCIHVMLPDDPRLRETVVTPHALGDYDWLADKEQHNDE
jgi:hypothetical protein